MQAVFSNTKRIALILFISACGLTTKLQAQQHDTTKIVYLTTLPAGDSTAQIPKSYLYYQLRTGLLGGFQGVNKDTTNITLCIPFEYNFRYYPAHSIYHYWDFSTSFQGIVLNRNILTVIVGGTVGYGWVSKTYNDNIQVHAGYFYGSIRNHPDLRPYQDIILFGYGFEVASVPLVFDILLPLHQQFSTKNSILEVGVKLPVLSSDIAH